jgi:hypothetical protein
MGSRRAAALLQNGQKTLDQRQTAQRDRAPFWRLQIRQSSLDLPAIPGDRIRHVPSHLLRQGEYTLDTKGAKTVHLVGIEQDARLDRGRPARLNCLRRMLANGLNDALRPRGRVRQIGKDLLGRRCAVGDMVRLVVERLVDVVQQHRKR